MCDTPVCPTLGKWSGNVWFRSLGSWDTNNLGKPFLAGGFRSKVVGAALGPKALHFEYCVRVCRLMLRVFFQHITKVSGISFWMSLTMFPVEVLNIRTFLT